MDKYEIGKEDKDGYLGVCFEGRRINRIVAITFIPNPDNLEIADHIDRKNNCVSNLRWVGNNRNKISNSKVDICDKDGNILKSFDSISEAAEYYNVPDDNAAVVVNKKIGGYVKYSEK